MRTVYKVLLGIGSFVAAATATSVISSYANSSALYTRLESMVGSESTPLQAVQQVEWEIEEREREMIPVHLISAPFNLFESRTLNGFRKAHNLPERIALD